MRELKTIDEILEGLYNRKDVIVVDDNKVVDCINWYKDNYIPRSSLGGYNLPIRKGFRYFGEE